MVACTQNLLRWLDWDTRSEGHGQDFAFLGC